MRDALRGKDSRPQRPRSFRSAPKIANSDRVKRHSGFEWLCKHNRLRPQPIRFVRLDSEHAQSDVKSVNHGLPVLDLARGRDLHHWPKGSRPLGTRMQGSPGWFGFLIQVTHFRSAEIAIWCYLFICRKLAFLHMCNPALSKLIFNLLTGRVSAQNYFRRQLRSNLFISVHTHSILSTHSIPHLMPTILIHCAMTQWMR